MFTISPIRVVLLEFSQNGDYNKIPSYSNGQWFTGLKYSNQIFQDEADHSSSFFLLSFFLTTPKLNSQIISNNFYSSKTHNADAADVHTYIVNFVAGNETAEAKLQAYEGQNNERLDYIALKDHYEGIGFHAALDITKGESVLSNLHYGGEKKPHMWWEEFEKQLTSAFTTYNKREGRMVHSPEMKLRILLTKVTADFLVPAKAGIGIELTRIPMTLTYEQALATFRNEVNRKFPPQMSSATKARRNINERGQGRGRGARFGRANHGGRGRGGRGGRGNRSPCENSQ
jgi:hypothetical protein